MATDVVVTGGAGFVGSHLCDRLLAEGHRVTAIDDLSTGCRENVAHLLEHPRFQLIEHDITAPYDVPAERIFNLACPASPPQYQRDPVRTTRVSFEGTLHGLELAKRHSARFLQASTSEVYGDPTVHPQPEDYRGNVNPIGPRACYDEGKRCAESLCFDFHRAEHVDVRVARIFNTYGPRMGFDDGRVVSNFIVQALKGEPLTIFGDGLQTRSFCYVDDLVDGLIRLMDHPEVCGPINLGSDYEFTVLELAELVRKLTRSESALLRHPLPEDDPKQRRPNLTRARTCLGYEPHTSLEEGLRRTIADFSSRLSMTSSTGRSRAFA